MAISSITAVQNSSRQNYHHDREQAIQCVKEKRKSQPTSPATPQDRVDIMRQTQAEVIIQNGTTANRGIGVRNHIDSIRDAFGC